MKHLVLIDGHHLMHRAYWAIPRTLRTSKGEQANAVFGFASMILAILRQEEPNNFLICFDAGEETFRHEEYEQYKDGRQETPDDFYVQIPRIMELIESWGLSHVSDKRYEADDFLGTYAHAGYDAGMRVTIVTGDRDAFQLANDHIRIAIPHKGYAQAEYLGPQEIEEKYGVTPEQIPAFKGLTGDSSDNLPGVKGIGPKTAAILLQGHGSLEGIYDHMDDIKPSVRDKLIADKEQAFFCQRMARLDCAIDLPLPLKSLALRTLSLEALHVFFTEMEFSLLMKRLQSFCETQYGSTLYGEDTQKFSVPDNSHKEEQLTLL
jgi:DNA polymerase I